MIQRSQLVKGKEESTLSSGSLSSSTTLGDAWASSRTLNALTGVTDGSGQKATTAGGTWVAKSYVLKPGIKDKSARGADITLFFHPNESVNATKIVLVQTVRTVKNWKLDFLDDTSRQRSNYGTAIDQDQRSKSPVYSADPDASPSSLGEHTDTQFGEAGYRYFASKSRDSERIKPAWLRDVPHRRGIDPKNFSSQIFETTALAAAGPDEGTYYGSVQWGWYIDRNGAHLLIPLQVISFGNVSDLFVKAVQEWNRTKTSQDQTPLSLPYEYELPSSLGSINS